MQEIAQGPALWMWDYLRRSGARGFFLPLSGGADSAAVASLVASMAQLVLENSKTNPDTLKSLKKIVRNDDFSPSSYQEIVE
jgi:NAD+ synthase (glutamine-hydrolysing)